MRSRACVAVDGGFADADLVACSFVVKSERGPDCYILFATSKVILRYGWRDADLLVRQLQGCAQIMEAEKKAGEGCS